MTEPSRRRDVTLLAGLGAAAVAMAVWAVALVGLDVRLAAVVPHLLIGGIGVAAFQEHAT
ncbi:MAG TPA: hypothetical protein VJ978_08220 [Nitriliruptoraceae bacterium]|nr:hypothetical protein [Nitriliruptoraceae bacterium]